MPDPVVAEIMNVRAKVIRSLSAVASASSFDLSATRSTLLSRRMRPAFAKVPFSSRARIRSTSSSSPLAASTTSTTTSASPAPPHAASTIARSSRPLGVNMPGVSTKISWLLPCMAIPRTGTRVVWTL